MKRIYTIAIAFVLGMTAFTSCQDGDKNLDNISSEEEYFESISGGESWAIGEIGETSQLWTFVDDEGNVLDEQMDEYIAFNNSISFPEIGNENAKLNACLDPAYIDAKLIHNSPGSGKGLAFDGMRDLYRCPSSWFQVRIDTFIPNPGPFDPQPNTYVCNNGRGGYTLYLPVDILARRNVTRWHNTVPKKINSEDDYYLGNTSYFTGGDWVLYLCDEPAGGHGYSHQLVINPSNTYTYFIFGGADDDNNSIMYSPAGTPYGGQCTPLFSDSGSGTIYSNQTWGAEYQITENQPWIRTFGAGGFYNQLRYEKNINCN